MPAAATAVAAGAIARYIGQWLSILSVQRPLTDRNNGLKDMTQLRLVLQLN
jgi:hypothetical protein